MVNWEQLFASKPLKSQKSTSVSSSWAVPLYTKSVIALASKMLNEKLKCVAWACPNIVELEQTLYNSLLHYIYVKTDVKFLSAYCPIWQSVCMEIKFNVPAWWKIKLLTATLKVWVYGYIYQNEGIVQTCALQNGVDLYQTIDVVFVAT